MSFCLQKIKMDKNKMLNKNELPEKPLDYIFTRLKEDYHRFDDRDNDSRSRPAHSGNRILRQPLRPGFPKNDIAESQVARSEQGEAGACHWLVQRIS